MASSSRPPRPRSRALALVHDEVCECRACPRLVEWREAMATEKRASYREQTYWGRPVPGFGDPSARIAVIGLAPAAHGANRTGRVFTGDRSGEWLYRSMYEAGLANQPNSTHVGDGLALTGAWVTSVVKCAPPDNDPSTAERDRCLPFLRRELAALKNVRVFVCLGAFAFGALTTEFGVRPKPRFGHGVEIEVDGRTVIGSFHPSQQNTFTGRLTKEMFDSIFERAVAVAGR